MISLSQARERGRHAPGRREGKIDHMQAIVIYHGPSMLDGSPIVCLATLGSTNVKTGPLVQTWIMRADMTPIEASQTKSDGAVCGTCPRRHSLGGDCYVPIILAPRAAFVKWEADGRGGENWTEPNIIVQLTESARAHGLRLGSYGDPAAVPHHVWADLIAALAPRAVVGYTHQWRTEWFMTDHLDKDRAHRLWLRDNVMASCDSPADAQEARENGWRYFMAVGPGIEAPRNTIMCLADREGSTTTCEECGICDGAKGRATRTSVYIVEHGVRSDFKHKRALTAIKPSTMVVL